MDSDSSSNDSSSAPVPMVNFRRVRALPLRQLSLDLRAGGLSSLDILKLTKARRRRNMMLVQAIENFESKEEENDELEMSSLSDSSDPDLSLQKECDADCEIVSDQMSSQNSVDFQDVIISHVETMKIKQTKRISISKRIPVKCYLHQLSDNYC
jgi:hypothetical protein